MLARVQFDGPGWSSACLRATQILRCDPPDYRPTLFTSAGPARTWATPLEALEWLARDQSQTWYGFLSYDLGRWFEALPTQAVDDRQLPLLAFMTGDPIDPINPSDSPAPQVLARPTFSRAEYESRIAKCLDYIRAGDVFQINLSQRFRVPLVERPEQIYARLQARTPAKYAAFLDFGDFQLMSNSPELFLEQDAEKKLTTRPIKGTLALRESEHFGVSIHDSSSMKSTHAEHLLNTRLTKTTSIADDFYSVSPQALRRPAHDRATPADLLRVSLKDAAELNMIIDLERNDLGRVCEIGSVKVTQPRTIETHPTLVHGVATIEGTLRRESTFVDLLRATFPGGSITGAPKIRAMQIIEELEPHRRGPYCGAIGMIRPDGTHTFNIAIRTMIIRDSSVDVQVGGGIVADSVPREEYEETLIKARAMFDALGVKKIVSSLDDEALGTP